MNLIDKAILLNMCGVYVTYLTIADPLIMHYYEP